MGGRQGRDRRHGPFELGTWMVRLWSLRSVCWLWRARLTLLRALSPGGLNAGSAKASDRMRPEVSGRRPLARAGGALFLGTSVLAPSPSVSVTPARADIEGEGAQGERPRTVVAGHLRESPFSQVARRHRPRSRRVAAREGLAALRFDNVRVSTCPLPPLRKRQPPPRVRHQHAPAKTNRASPQVARLASSSCDEACDHARSRGSERTQVLGSSTASRFYSFTLVISSTLKS